MPKYRIKSGAKHYGSGNGGLKLYKGGDEIELTESQARAFLDKLDPIGPTLQEELAEKSVEENVDRLRPQIVPSPVREGFFDVLHAETDDPMNERPLSRKEAEEMIGFTAEE